MGGPSVKAKLVQVTLVSQNNVFCIAFICKYVKKKRAGIFLIYSHFIILSTHLKGIDREGCSSY